MTMIRCAWERCGLVMEAHGNMDVVRRHFADVHPPPPGWQIINYAGGFVGEVMVTSPTLGPCGSFEEADPDALGPYYAGMQPHREMP